MISAVDAGNQQIRLGVVEVADVRQCELESPPRCHTLLSFALLLRLLGFGPAIQHVMRATLTFVPTYDPNPHGASVLHVAQLGCQEIQRVYITPFFWFMV